jgi:hypothetical protein
MPESFLYTITMKTIRFRTIFILLGVLSALCLLSPVIIGLASAAMTYDGTCYGLTDGASTCSWWQYAQNQMFWGSMIAFSPAIFLFTGWLMALGLWGAILLQPDRQKLPLWQAVLIPMAAFALGLLLIYFLPIATGLRR